MQKPSFTHNFFLIQAKQKTYVNLPMSEKWIEDKNCWQETNIDCALLSSLAHVQRINPFYPSCNSSRRCLQCSIIIIIMQWFEGCQCDITVTFGHLIWPFQSGYQQNKQGDIYYHTNQGEPRKIGFGVALLQIIHLITTTFCTVAHEMERKLFV